MSYTAGELFARVEHAKSIVHCGDRTVHWEKLGDAKVPKNDLHRKMSPNPVFQHRSPSTNAIVVEEQPLLVELRILQQHLHALIGQWKQLVEVLVNVQELLLVPCAARCRWKSNCFMLSLGLGCDDIRRTVLRKGHHALPLLGAWR